MRRVKRFIIAFVLALLMFGATVAVGFGMAMVSRAFGPAWAIVPLFVVGAAVIAFIFSADPL